MLVFVLLMVRYWFSLFGGPWCEWFKADGLLQCQHAGGAAHAYRSSKETPPWLQCWAAVQQQRRRLRQVVCRRRTPWRT
jgi:hypothetical protein